MNSYNGYRFKPGPLTMRVMFTDAEEGYAEEGYGGFIASRLNDIIFCSKFSQNEKQTSLKYRESFAVKYV